MTKGMVGEQNLEKQHIEKQMGCMTGFLHIFDRHHILAGKRIYTAKTLPPSVPLETDSSPEPENYGVSPVESTPTPSSPERVTQSPTQAPPKTPLRLPVFEFKEGTRTSWKFSREVPRLSLDSRAVVDAKGTLRPREIRTNRCDNPGGGEKQRRSTSVVARLMGLEEPIPDSDSDPELRRSASESRVSRDLPQYRFFDSNNFQLKQLNNAVVDDSLSNGRASDPKGFGVAVRNAKTEQARAGLRIRGMGQKKSFYDSADFFPEPKHGVSVYGEMERRLKMRGIDEPSKDLDTLKQILEALQLKGLLHSNKSEPPTTHRNFVFDGTVSGNESPIVVMKPGKSLSSLNRRGRTGSDSPSPSGFGSSPRARRNNETLSAASPRRDRPESYRNIRAQSQGRPRNSGSPVRSESNVRSPNRMRKVNNGVAPVHSAKIKSRRNGPDQLVTSRSPRMRKATYHREEEKVMMDVAEDESSAISESSFSTSSHTDIERFKMEEYKEGRNLLERCDKLLNSIAEITAATTELQPSPVSVLDPSFYKDESSCSPSPVMKRCIDYKDLAADSEDDMWSAVLCCSEAKSEDSEDLVYVWEILCASNYLPDDGDVFLLLEKQQYLKGNDTSKASTLRRRLIFDTIHEILNRNRRLPPWKAVSWAENNTPLLHRIWSEFRRIREREEESEDLFEVICGVLRKDLAEDAMNEWGECPVEMGDVVLDMERLVFKDLIGETIRDIASFKGTQCNKVSALRRKLVF